MPDLLDRSTALIAALGAAGGRPLALGQVAAASGIPPATCSRLLKRLAALGWVDQDGNRGAYRLGPRPFALAAGEAYAPHLVAAVLPAMRALADATGGGCTLSVLRPWRRQLLWECGGVHGAVGRQGLREEDDVWVRASGRLLVAALPAAQRARWIAQLGLPSPRQWPGIATPGELVAELAALRRQGWAESEDPRMATRGAAVLVGTTGERAALGLFLPVARWNADILARLRSLSPRPPAPPRPPGGSARPPSRSRGGGR